MFDKFSSFISWHTIEHTSFFALFPLSNQANNMQSVIIALYTKKFTSLETTSSNEN
jgi:hypothetical protein